MSQENQAAQSQRKQEYLRFVQGRTPKPPYIRNTVAAFLVGGAIVTVGQGIQNILLATGADKLQASSRTAVIMLFLGALLTGLGVYDRIGRLGGAGAAIPITGFANSIVAPAMEFRSEGFVLGMAAQLFVVAGPVIVYGVTAAVVMGLLRFIVGGG